MTESDPKKKNTRKKFESWFRSAQSEQSDVKFQKSFFFFLGDWSFRKYVGLTIRMRRFKFTQPDTLSLEE